MFVFLLAVLRLTGKRGVKQLSLFEIVIIISLGSAAGDPMFQEDVGLLPAMTVLVIVILLYKIATWLTAKSRWFELKLEGKTEQLIENGRFSMSGLDRENLAQDEFFTELRMRGVEHLGQVRSAFLETTGEISMYFYENAEVKAGLPVSPEEFEKKVSRIERADDYACTRCGYVTKLAEGSHICDVCGRDEWVKALSTKRVT